MAAIGRQRAILTVALAVALGYAWLSGGFIGLGSGDSAPSQPPVAGSLLATATFATGCFWCTEADFDALDGVVSTTSGYTGGILPNPDYRSVSRGGTGHAEAVQVLYDPARVSYETLLEHFWRNVDPFNANRQFCDVGTQYRPEIFVYTPVQRAAAEASKARIQARFQGQTVVVAISAAGPFYPAEGYHQDYHRRNPVQYRFYRFTCGRDARLEAIRGLGRP